MQRLSSQLTLLLRIAIPTVWASAILALLVLLGWSVRGKAGLFGNPFVWIGIAVILGSGLALMKLIFWRYYRIDADDRFLYVSNYFRTYRYPHGEIESVKASTRLPGRSYTIRLRSKGYFGQKIRFLASPSLLADYLSTHPDLKEKWFGPERDAHTA